MRGLKLLILKILGLFFPKWQIIPKEAGTTGGLNLYDKLSTPFLII